MRTTILAVLCAFPACLPSVGPERQHAFGPDAGVDGASSTQPPGECRDLAVVTGDRTISGASGFDALPKTCWQLDGKLKLYGVGLTSIEKLGDLRSVTHLEIADTALTAFKPKAPLAVTGNIYVGYNDQLVEIANVTPKSVVASITVEYNGALTSLGALSKASVVSGATWIANNPRLASVDLSAAARLEGGLVIQDNPALQTVTLTALQSVAALTIARNPALATLSVGSSLTNLHGTLTIDDNDALVSLGSIGSGANIDLNLIVTNNAALTNLGNLARASRVGGVAQFSDNASLTHSRVHDVGCCVPTGGFQSLNNKNQNTCDGNHPCSGGCYR